MGLCTVYYGLERSGLQAFSESTRTGVGQTSEFVKAQRKKVEALFAQLKNQIGLRRLRLRRLKFVREQFFLAATVQNMKGLVRFLSSEPAPKLVTAQTDVQSREKGRTCETSWVAVRSLTSGSASRNGRNGGNLRTAGGTAIALPCVWALGRLVESQLYDVKPTHPVTILAATLILCSTALGAALIPARRASAVNPTEALRFG
jgi:hypothetical protein